IILVIVLPLFLSLMVQTVSLASTQFMRTKLQAILKNKSIRTDTESDLLLLQLSDNVRNLTRQVQLVDNQYLVKKEEIVEVERKRIARDLHDTVSQEL
ncbi:histidine kinase, partial [Streptococcus suis]